MLSARHARQSTRVALELAVTVLSVFVTLVVFWFGFGGKHSDPIELCVFGLLSGIGRFFFWRLFDRLFSSTTARVVTAFVYDIADGPDRRAVDGTDVVEDRILRRRRI